MQQELADFIPLETDKFGRKYKLIDGHNLPSHRCLFGHADEAVWEEETHGIQRSIYTFDTDERDGIKEDDLYDLAE